MSPRRILLVAHAFLPDSHAGVEVYTARLARALERRGHEVAVLCGRVRAGAAQYAVAEERVEGLRTFGLVQNYPYRDLPLAVADPAVDRAAAGTMATFRPDVVAVQTLFGLSLGVMSAAKAAGAALVLHLHDGWWSCPSGGQRLHPDGALCLPVDRARCGACFDRFRHREGPLERAGQWLAARLPGSVPPDLLHRGFAALPTGARDRIRTINERAGRRAGAAVAERAGPDPRIVDRARRIDAALAEVDGVVSPTRFLADSLRADGIALPPVHVEPTGVPAVGGRPMRSEGPLRALFVGTWVPHKGPQVLAEALATLPPGLVEARALGPAPFPAFRDDVLRAAGGRLEALPAVPPDAVGAIVDAHDVVVVPSTWAENGPLVVLEARARRRPVIASDLGGLRELVAEGEDGWRVPPSDPAALAALLRRLAGDRGELLAVAGRVRLPPTVDDLAARLERRYEEALG
jgi:glycosyltransferase involved in cell wall biosynthesis